VKLTTFACFSRKIIKNIFKVENNKRYEKDYNTIKNKISEQNANIRHEWLVMHENQYICMSIV